jgi:mannitol/fructose-specific phosphotransferase system IIA component (Ntr-type)
VLDIEGSVTMEDFFKMAAEHVREKTEIDKERVYQLLIERERESSTVLAPGLAIPHIIIEGKEKFHILLARSKGGIIFKYKGSEQKVHTVFLLLGSKDERNFHLKALAAIAEIVQRKDFSGRWMRARNDQELRDIVLLAERQRAGSLF